MCGRSPRNDYQSRDEKYYSQDPVGIWIRLGRFGVSSRGRMSARVGPVTVSGGGRNRRRRKHPRRAHVHPLVWASALLATVALFVAGHFVASKPARNGGQSNRSHRRGPAPFTLAQRLRYLEGVLSFARVNGMGPWPNVHCRPLYPTKALCTGSRDSGKPRTMRWDVSLTIGGHYRAEPVAGR
jgi:hypothetical protein